MIIRKGTSKGADRAPFSPKKAMEIWKDIPGYVGRYQVSNLGRVKSLERKVRSKNHYTGKEFMRTVKERILQPGEYCKTGHLSVVLGRGSNGKPVHQLVMKAFIGDPPKDMEVLHLNGNPKDNRLSNLRYGSRTENILDVYWQGGRWRKLSMEDVQVIRFMLFCGMTGAEIARIHNVSDTTISNIKHGRTFGWLK